MILTVTLNPMLDKTVEGMGAFDLEVVAGATSDPIPGRSVRARSAWRRDTGVPGTDPSESAAAGSVSTCSGSAWCMTWPTFTS